MTDTQKFEADIRRIQKYDRAEHNGQHDAARICKKVTDRFEKENVSLGALPRSIADYWYKTYILPSKTPDQEPTGEHINWLSDVLMLLDGSNPEETVLTAADWKNLRELVNYEAEDLPIDILSSLMTVFVDRNAL